jgi:hypothetical protein
MALVLFICVSSFRTESAHVNAQTAPAPALEFELVQTPIYEETWLPTVPPPGANAAATYKSIYDRYDICGRVQRNELDELWVWTGDGDRITKPDMWEWTASGPGISADLGMDLVAPNCGRVFTTMNFSYKRPDVGLHNFGHRAEGFLGRFVPCDFMTHTWPWNANFYYAARCPNAAYYYRDSDAFVARAGAANNNTAACGDVHFPPNITNSSPGYDYASSATVNTICRGWSQNNASVAEPITCDAWACNGADYLVWWMQNFPGPNNNNKKRDGRNNNNKKRDGSAHTNWWPYLFGEPTIAPPATATPRPTASRTPAPASTSTPAPAATATGVSTATPTAPPNATSSPSQTATPPQGTTVPTTTSNPPTATSATTAGPDRTRARAYLPLITDRNTTQAVAAAAPTQHTHDTVSEHPAGGIVARRAAIAGASQQPAVMKKKLLVVILAAYGDLPPGGRAEVERMNIFNMAEIRRASTYQGYRYETRLTATFLGQDGATYAGMGCTQGGTVINAHVRLSGMRQDSAPVSYRLEDTTHLGVWATPCDPVSNWLLYVTNASGGNADVYFRPFVTAPAGTQYNVRVTYADGGTQSVSFVGTSITP